MAAKKKPTKTDAPVRLSTRILDLLEVNGGQLATRYQATMSYEYDTPAGVKTGFMRGGPAETEAAAFNNLFTQNPDMLGRRVAEIFRATKSVLVVPVTKAAPKE